MTIYIIVFTCIISFLALQNEGTMHRLIFNSVEVSERGEWWRFITSGFVHGSWLHLFVNMYAFYYFGQQVEGFYNSMFEVGAGFKFLILYFGGMVAAMIPSYNAHKHDPTYNSLGASGAISAVVLTSILLDPLETIGVFFIIPMPGIIAGILFFVYSYYSSKRGGTYINHSAHMWGGIFGIAFTLAMKPLVLTHFISQISNALHR